MKPLLQRLWQRWFVTKNKPRAKLGLCMLGICWLAGCASPPPVQTEVNSKAVDQPNPAPAAAQSTKSPLNIETSPESQEKEAREIHDEECVFFSLGSSIVDRKEKHKIDALTQRLLNDKNLVVTLIGHANDNGSSSFNLAVSDSRVMAVAAQLRKHGIQKSRIRKEALGSERTPKSCRSADCRQRSRRVEFVITEQR